MDQTGPKFLWSRIAEAVGARTASFSRARWGWAAGSGPKGHRGRAAGAAQQGPRRRVRAAKAAAGEL
jgi:hypothetical protein